jgi:hypothetical protein
MTRGATNRNQKIMQNIYLLFEVKKPDAASADICTHDTDEVVAPYTDGMAALKALSYYGFITDLFSERPRVTDKSGKTVAYLQELTVLKDHPERC